MYKSHCSDGKPIYRWRHFSFIDLFASAIFNHRNHTTRTKPLDSADPARSVSLVMRLAPRSVQNGRTEADWTASPAAPSRRENISSGEHTEPFDRIHNHPAFGEHTECPGLRADVRNKKKNNRDPDNCTQLRLFGPYSVSSCVRTSIGNNQRFFFFYAKLRQIRCCTDNIFQLAALSIHYGQLDSLQPPHIRPVNGKPDKHIPSRREIFSFMPRTTR